MLPHCICYAAKLLCFSLAYMRLNLHVAELVAMTTTVPVGRRKMCFTLQTWIFYSTYNLTHLGRDTFIYGLLITHQSLGGLFMRIFVCLDRTHKHKHSIAQSPPFSKTTGHFLWAPCVWIHSWNQMAENDLNSFFKHSTPGGIWKYSGVWKWDTHLQIKLYRPSLRAQTRDTLICLFDAL